MAYGSDHIRRIDNTGSGQLTLRVKAIANARNCNIQHQTLPSLAIPALASAAPGPWTSAGIVSFTRGMPVNGLTSGQLYSFRVRAIGGSTGQTDWSDPVSHMSL